MENYIFTNPLAYACAWTIVHSVWQILLITFFAAVIQSLLQKKEAILRYNLMCLASFAIGVSSVITFFVMYSSANLIKAPKILGVNSISANDQISKTTVVSDFEGGFISSIAEYTDKHLILICTIWVLGMMVAMIRLIGNISFALYVKNKFNFPVDEHWNDLLEKIGRQLGIKKQVELLESAFVKSPVVMGVLKPVIFFPIGAINRLNVDEVEAILAHELAHILRNDYLINILLSVVESVFYYHPAIWWLNNQIKREREYCCDDIAIQYTGNSFNYAKSLVTVQEMAMYSPYLAMAFANHSNKNELMTRVNRLIKKSSNSINMKEKSISGFILAAFLLFIFMAFRPFDKSIETKNVNERFLLYENEGKTDSLMLDYEIEDGEYKHVTSEFNLNLVVRDRAVVSMNINGIDVKGNDILKFKNLINNALQPDKTDENSIDVEGDLVEGTEDEVNCNTVESFDHVVYDRLVEMLKEDQLLTKKVNEIVLKKSFASVNGKRLNDKKYQSFYEEIEELFEEGSTIKLKVTNGAVVLIEQNSPGSNYSYTYSYNSDDQESNPTHIPPPPNPPTPPKFSNLSPPTPLKNNLKEMTKEERKAHNKAMEQHDRDMRQHQIDMAEHEKSIEEHNKAMEKHEQYVVAHNESVRKHNEQMQKANEFRDRLVQMLIEDGYIKKEEDVRINWNNNFMNVNDKMVSKSHIARYTKVYESYGWIIGKSFNYTSTITH